MIEVQKSHFQVSKMLKMNIIKHWNISRKLTINLKNFDQARWYDFSIRLAKWGITDFTQNFKIMTFQTPILYTISFG